MSLDDFVIKSKLGKFQPYSTFIRRRILQLGLQSEKKQRWQHLRFEESKHGQSFIERVTECSERSQNIGFHKPSERCLLQRMFYL